MQLPGFKNSCVENVYLMTHLHRCSQARTRNTAWLPPRKLPPPRLPQQCTEGLSVRVLIPVHSTCERHSYNSLLPLVESIHSRPARRSCTKNLGSASGTACNGDDIKPVFFIHVHGRLKAFVNVRTCTVHVQTTAYKFYRCVGRRILFLLVWDLALLHDPL